MFVDQQWCLETHILPVSYMDHNSLYLVQSGRVCIFLLWHVYRELYYRNIKMKFLLPFDFRTDMSLKL